MILIALVAHHSGGRFKDYLPNTEEIMSAERDT